MEQRDGSLTLLERQRDGGHDLLRHSHRVHCEGRRLEGLGDLPENLPISGVDGEPPGQAGLDEVRGVEGAGRLDGRQLHVGDDVDGVGVVLEGRQRHAVECDGVELDLAQLHVRLTPGGLEADLHGVHDGVVLRRHGEAPPLAAAEEVHGGRGGQHDPAPVGESRLHGPVGGVVVDGDERGGEAVLAQVQVRGRVEADGERRLLALEHAAPLRVGVAVEQRLRRVARLAERRRGQLQVAVGQAVGALRDGLEEDGEGRRVLLVEGREGDGEEVVAVLEHVAAQAVVHEVLVHLAPRYPVAVEEQRDGRRAEHEQVERLDGRLLHAEPVSEAHVVPGGRDVDGSRREPRGVFFVPARVPALVDALRLAHTPLRVAVDQQPRVEGERVAVGREGRVGQRTPRLATLREGEDNSRLEVGEGVGEGETQVKRQATRPRRRLRRREPLVERVHARREAEELGLRHLLVSHV